MTANESVTLRTASHTGRGFERLQIDAMGPMGINSQGAFLRYREQVDVCEARLGLLWPQEDMVSEWVLES